MESMVLRKSNTSEEDQLQIKEDEDYGASLTSNRTATWSAVDVGWEMFVPVGGARHKAEDSTRCCVAACSI